MDILPSHQLPGITISVGNITVGGTGKTPIVIALVQHLQQRGNTPAILTRGYRSGLARQDSMVLKGHETIIFPQVPGLYHADEAIMQAHQLRDVPVIVGRHRLAAARRYLAHYDPPSHWILDDGFQHFMIKRDLDLVLLDEARPFDNGYLLPLGRLRELPDALGRASLIFFTRAKDPPTPSPIAADLLQKLGIPFASIPFTNDAPMQMSGLTSNYAELKHVAVVTAIAEPTQILNYPSRYHQTVAAQLVKNDHERFHPTEITKVAVHAEAILTTSKDYHRDPNVFNTAPCPVFILPLRVACSFEQLDSLLDLPGGP